MEISLPMQAESVFVLPLETAVNRQCESETDTEPTNDPKDNHFSSATPTTCEKKLSNLYSFVEDSSVSDCKSEPSDSEEEGDDEDGAIVDGVLEGYRLVDLDILSRNIGVQLSCK